MDFNELRYSLEHLWVRADEDLIVTVGISEEAFQDSDEIIKIRLPEEGEEVVKNEAFGRLTTHRPSVYRLYSPVTGEVVEVNDEIIDAPEMILEDPYDEGWLIRVEMATIAELDELMTREEYEDFLADHSLLDDDDIDADDEDI